MTDPIDDFFEREREAVPSLAAPPGLLGELQTVARRRRTRNTTMVSAAAAAVVAVIGTGAVLTSQNLGHHTTLAGPAASTSSAAGNSTSPTGPAVDATVPVGFSGWSVSFVSASHGFALGGYPCENKNECFGILETTDAMNSWHTIAEPGFAAEYGITPANAIIRFSDASNGWMVGSEGVWSTHDGGRNWRPIAALQDQHIDALEASDGHTYALGHGTTALWVSTDSSDDSSWAAQPSVALDMAPTDATDSLAATNRAVAAVRSQGSTTTVRLSLDFGASWQIVVAPCGASGGRAPLFSLVDETIGRFVCGDGTVEGVKFGTAPVVDTTFPLVTTTGAPVVGHSSSTDHNGTFFAYSGAGIWAYLENHTASHVLSGDVGYVGLTNDTQGIALPAVPDGTYWITQTGGLHWMQRSWG